MGGSTRREFLRNATLTSAAAWLSLHWPALLAAGEAAARARDAGEAFRHLSADDATDFAAIAAQIFPSGDDLPGADEAGVIHFIDRALGTFMAPAAASLRDGLAALNAAAKDAGAERFAGLSAKKQKRLLTEHEEGSFFQTLRFLTIAGMFSLPSYGGNREFAGWQLIGLEPRHAWLPPFGHYDAEAGKDA